VVNSIPARRTPGGREAWPRCGPNAATDDISILAVRERLERATYIDERCRCRWPLAALDEDDS
jgi:hypothetical protein